MSTGSLPSLPARQSAASSFEVDDHIAPTAEELPEGSAQVTFTMIPDGETYRIYTHTAGIYTSEDFLTFLDAAAEHGGEPEFA